MHDYLTHRSVLLFMVYTSRVATPGQRHDNQ